jgi:hypothetical protein
MKRRAQKQSVTNLSRVREYMQAYPEAKAGEIIAALKMNQQQVYEARCSIRRERGLPPGITPKKKPVKVEAVGELQIIELLSDRLVCRIGDFMLTISRP